MPRLAILWHLGVTPGTTPPGKHSFRDIAKAIKEATHAPANSTCCAYAGGWDGVSVYESERIKAELSEEGINLRTFNNSLLDIEIERAIVCDLLSFSLGCSATERVGRPTVALVVDNPEPYLGAIQVLRSNRFKVTLILSREHSSAYSTQADQVLNWDEVMKDSVPSTSPGPGNTRLPSITPAIPLPAPSRPPGLATKGAAPHSPEPSTSADDDWERELDALLKGLDLKTSLPTHPHPPPSPPGRSPDASQGLVWDLTDDDLARRKAAAIGSPAWHARIDQASPPPFAPPRPGWDAGGANGGGWEDALTAIARQTASPLSDLSASQSTLTRLVEAQQQIGETGGVPATSSDWLDTLLSESTSAAASASASQASPVATGTPITPRASPAPAAPWVTVMRGAKTPAAHEEEKERLYAPLLEAVKVQMEAVGARKVNRGLVGSHLHPTAKAKARFYQGLPQGMDDFRSYTHAAERAGVVVLHNTGDRDGTIELAPVRQAKAHSLGASGLGGRAVPGLGTSWKAAGKAARGGAR